MREPTHGEARRGGRRPGWILALALGALLACGAPGAAARPAKGKGKQRQACKAGQQPRTPPPAPGVADPPGPGKGQIEVRKGKILLGDPIAFKPISGELLPQSHAILDKVARLLTSGQSGGRLRIESHTDARGSAAFNKAQSQRRADAVRAYLVSKGVIAGRLLAVGYGEERPIADNLTAQGRAKNRRVELVLLP